MKKLNVAINIISWALMIFCLLAIAWPNLINPYIVKPLQKYDRQSREAIMVIYAQDVQKILQDNYQRILSNGSGLAETLNQYIHSQRPYGFTTPYNPQDGPVEVIDVDNDNLPRQLGLTKLFNKIGYYSDGQQYRLCVWRRDNTLLKVLSGKRESI